MSVGELNHLMTYVIDGWMLFSAGFIGIEFVSFVSRRVQEDIEAEAVALKQASEQTEAVSVAEAVETTVAQPAAQTVSVSTEAPSAPAQNLPTAPKAETKAPPSEQNGDELFGEEADLEALTVEDEARLEEVAAVSEKLAKTKNKQADTSSVSVSTSD